jgi:hypothetical protein
VADISIARKIVEPSNTLAVANVEQMEKKPTAKDKASN